MQASTVIQKLLTKFMKAKLLQMDINVGNNVDNASCGSLMKSPCLPQKNHFYRGINPEQPIRGHADARHFEILSRKADNSLEHRSGATKKKRICLTTFLLSAA